MEPLHIRRSGGARAGTRARVVIVDAGFGGLECARKLNRAPADVLLLDRTGYHPAHGTGQLGYVLPPPRPAYPDNSGDSA